MPGSLESPPLVISQKRSSYLVGAALFAGLGLFGWWASVTETQSFALFLKARLLLMPGGFTLAAFSLVGAVFPGRLSIGPQGLIYGRIGGRRIAWSRITEIGVWTGKQTSGVNVVVDDGAPLKLPGGWPMESQDLILTLRDAKARWTADPVAAALEAAKAVPAAPAPARQPTWSSAPVSPPVYAASVQPRFGKRGA